MRANPGKDRRDCIHFDTNVWLSLIVEEERLSDRAARYLDRTIYGKQTRVGMSVVVLGEIVYKLIESFRKDAATLMTALRFIERFIIRGAVVIHNLGDTDIETIQEIKKDTKIRRAHVPELLEIAVALRTGANSFETMDKMADNDTLRRYLKEKGLKLTRFSPR